MGRYAQNTEVTESKSRTEIERILIRYGADQFMYGWSSDSALVAFQMKGRRIQFRLPLPDRDSREFTHTEKGQERKSQETVSRLYDQAIRQRWRALALVIKAKLEAVDSGITEFEEEFLAHIVLPNGRTVGEFMVPQIATVYETGSMPALLPAPPA